MVKVELTKEQCTSLIQLIEGTGFTGKDVDKVASLLNALKKGLE